VATPTYTAIASITLGSSASSVTFSSIPQDYRDLIIVVGANIDVSSDILMTLNGDTTDTNYQMVRFRGDGSVAASQSNNDRQIGVNRAGAGTETIQIMDYSATDKYKTSGIRNSYTGGSPGQVVMVSSTYKSTAAVTNVKIEKSANSYLTGSTFALFGIAS